MRARQSVLFLVGLGGCLALASSLSAQTQLGELGKESFPKLKIWGSPRLVDVDRDGDLDVIYVGMKEDRLFLNDGQARFAEAPTGASLALPWFGFKKARIVIPGLASSASTPTRPSKACPS